MQLNIRILLYWIIGNCCQDEFAVRVGCCNFLHNRNMIELCKGQKDACAGWLHLHINSTVMNLKIEKHDNNNHMLKDG